MNLHGMTETRYIEILEEHAKTPEDRCKSAQTRLTELFDERDTLTEENERLRACATNLITSLDKGTARLMVLDDEEHGGWREGNVDSLRAALAETRDADEGTGKAGTKG